MNSCITNLLYLDQVYHYQAEAKIVDIINSDDKIAIVLDQTIFYPQSGGQPSDKGIIAKNKSAEFDVEKVIFDNERIQHLGKIKNGNFVINDHVNLIVDEKLRMLHNKYHTAGHLIDYALTNSGYNLISLKGYHFPNGAYVEYAGILDQNIREQLMITLSHEINKLIKEAHSVFLRKYSKDEFISKVKNVPEVKEWPVRAMSIDGYAPIMCGGTHVANTSEIGKVIIRKIKNVSGSLRISYEVEV